MGQQLSAVPSKPMINQLASVLLTNVTLHVYGPGPGLFPTKPTINVIYVSPAKSRISALRGGGSAMLS